MIILSCFDGMSCGHLALDRAGISVKKYYSSEIDKYAIQVTMKNYPNTIQLGSITEWQSWNIEKPDMIIGGSPCQGFSFAGKQLNFQDERSKLFFVFVDILKHYKPKYFLLENVIMKKEYNDVISRILGELYPECTTQQELFQEPRLEPIQINSALVSAQNRNRLYWTNIQGITQPKDKGILLKDIIEAGEVEKGISDKNIKYIIDKKGEPDKDLNRKSKCFTAGAHSCGTHSDMDLIPIVSKEQSDLKGRRQMVFTGGAIRGLGEIKNTEQKLEVNKTGKGNALTSVSKDSILCYTDNYIQYDLSGKGFNSQTNRIYYKDSKSMCLNKSNERYQLKETETETEILWRKLTPIECERLQTVPDNYTDCVSNSQRYKMLGNGWTIDVISHIFSFIKQDNILTKQINHSNNNP